MKETKLNPLKGARWIRLGYVFAIGVAIFLLGMFLHAQPPKDPNDPQLKVLKMGLGSGTVSSSPAGINCGGTCEAGFAGGASVTLTASAAAGSTFVGWDVDADGDPGTTADCTGSAATCTLSMSVARSVRPVFDLSTAIPALGSFTPEGIQTYLTTNPTVVTPAQFVKALPSEFKQNWILMARSESLQTGTAEFPRLLLPSANAQQVFSIGVAQHSSYPGAHPNAIEYMQWDAGQKNFRFHEIVVDSIPAMGSIPARNRGVSIDDEKCSRCHSTRNVVNLDRSVSPHVPGSTAGTDGNPPGTIPAKNKPNWDSYDSWGGMLPFNRDRIYQGSVEAAAFRKIFNPWTWSTNDSVRAIIEQLKLQPAGIPASSPDHRITRLKGGDSDGIIKFAFDTSVPVVTEPAPSGPSSTPVNYSFDRLAGSGPGTTVTQGGNFITLHHQDIPTSDEGRGVHFFDNLGGLAGNVNQTRVADELVNHRFATGSVPIDVRPIALAITKSGCLQRDSGSNTVRSLTATSLNSLSFFDSRNGMTINELFDDTQRRASTGVQEFRSRGLPRRKADIEKLTIDRTNDPYLVSASPTNGLIQQYGASTSAGTDTSIGRLRQEVFRRSVSPFPPDITVMGGVYVDREDYTSNSERVALYRYFLEPLGVSVDKWSMNVRGRSRAYNFADVFGSYLDVLEPTLKTSLMSNPVPGLTNPDDCDQLIQAINLTFSSLPPADGAGAIPKYTDVQRIFNKSCIECHGGLGYPPYVNYGTVLNLSENETPPAGQDRLERSYDLVTSAYISTDPRTSFLYERICPGAAGLPSANTPCPVPTPGTENENCPFGLMPCGGPRLSHTDIATIRRWIVGGAPNTRGDPHIETVDGVPYDFQGAGEFVLLRGQGLELQVRQTGIPTDGPLGPNAHTGLTSCVSVNTAAAVRLGEHRITYQPNLSGQPDPSGLQLRIDGKLTELTDAGIIFDSGGRVIKTSVAGGIQMEGTGGTAVVINPRFWDYYKVWLLDIDVRHARATDGVMGSLAPGSWLPALPNGSSLGPIPRDLHQRYLDLYDKFGNAWRVTDASSLFDYAPGTSTATFTASTWPEENPKVCVAPPRQPGGPVEKTPPKRLTLEAAQQNCAGVIKENAKANCLQDVMVTGEPEFAKLYLLDEQVEFHSPPAIPLLGFPEAFKTDVAAPVGFTWNQSRSLSGDSLTYKHCVWEVKERFSFNKCVLTAGTSLTGSFWRGGFWYALLVLLLILLLILILLWFRRRRPILLFVSAFVLLIAVGVAFYIGRNRRSNVNTLARTVPSLQAGKAYYWKVIVEDGKGGTTESETRRFEIK